MKDDVIFVVDRNTIHRSLIKYHLNVNKFSNVHIFQSGSECLYRIQKNLVPDFIIIDDDLSENTGFGFLQKIKKAAPSIQVIFFTAQDDPILAVRLLEAGATDYVVKTSKIDFGISELIKNIKYLVKESIPVRQY
ncbi:MAG: response regulator [Bacteroidales bacterium]|nr:response regulator [Bacteroidales bacterium]